MKNSKILNYLNTNKHKTYLYYTLNKSIKTNYSHNYIEPNTNEELEEIKDYLKLKKPKYLCIYFTNNWNPVAIKNNNLYNKFSTSQSSFTNLKIDTDKYPRLKWFFDNKCDPGFHFYYWGAKISSFGGANFNRALKEMNRIKDFTEKTPFDDQNLYYDKVEYEMPYYKYEEELSFKGNRNNIDPSQNFGDNNFNPLKFNLRYIPLEDNFVAKRIKV